jgi:glutaredoxin
MKNMKITVYTIADCQFSKQEKNYLDSVGLKYEERDLEKNNDWLTEMLTISDNFAGTPVTKIEKDDGSTVILKGFTQSEFELALGTKSTSANTQITNGGATTTNVKEDEQIESMAPTKSDSATATVAETHSGNTDTGRDYDKIKNQIEELKRMQEALLQKARSINTTADMGDVAQKSPQVVAPQQVVPPSVQSEPVVPLAPTPNYVTTPKPAQAQPQVAPTSTPDDSLAAILAELQAKINAANNPEPVTTTTQTAQNQG